jgi:hypothetical protein
MQRAALRGPHPSRTVFRPPRRDADIQRRHARWSAASNTLRRGRAEALALQDRQPAEVLQSGNLEGVAPLTMLGRERREESEPRKGFELRADLESGRKKFRGGTGYVPPCLVSSFQDSSNPRHARMT